MIRSAVALALVALAAPALALDLDPLVAKHAAANGVPEHLVRRVIKIESRGQPHLVSKGNYGLMQIRYGTARAMGYTGTPQGLLDADTNMTYAVRYLAGAYRVAGGNPDRAVRLYQRGYYDVAKAKGFSPYSLASQTSPPVERPAARQRKPKVAAQLDKPLDVSEQPATLQERFAAASAVKPVATQETVAVASPVKTVAPQEKIAVSSPVKAVAPREKPAVASPEKPVVPQETLAAAHKDKPVVRYRRAKASNKPFNLLTYLRSLAKPEKPARKVRHRAHRSATPRNAAPMFSAATPSAQKP